MMVDDHPINITKTILWKDENIERSLCHVPTCGSRVCAYNLTENSFSWFNAIYIFGIGLFINVACEKSTEEVEKVKCKLCKRESTFWQDLLYTLFLPEAQLFLISFFTHWHTGSRMLQCPSKLRCEEFGFLFPFLNTSLFFSVFCYNIR